MLVEGGVLIDGWSGGGIRIILHNIEEMYRDGSRLCIYTYLCTYCNVHAHSTPIQIYNNI